MATCGWIRVAQEAKGVGKNVGFAVEPKKGGGGQWKPVLQVGWFAYDRYDRWGACLLIGSKALVPKHQNTENKDS